MWSIPKALFSVFYGHSRAFLSIPAYFSHLALSEGIAGPQWIVSSSRITVRELPKRRSWPQHMNQYLGKNGQNRRTFKSYFDTNTRGFLLFTSSNRLCRRYLRFLRRLGRRKVSDRGLALGGTDRASRGLPHKIYKTKEETVAVKSLIRNTR